MSRTESPSSRAGSSRIARKFSRDEAGSFPGVVNPFAISIEWNQSLASTRLIASGLSIVSAPFEGVSGRSAVFVEHLHGLQRKEGQVLSGGVQLLEEVVGQRDGMASGGVGLKD